jgi:hypothetical protein
MKNGLVFIMKFDDLVGKNAFIQLGQPAAILIKLPNGSIKRILAGGVEAKVMAIESSFMTLHITRFYATDDQVHTQVTDILYPLKHLGSIQVML